MIQKKIICDRCRKVIFDSERKTGNKTSEFIDALFGTSSEQDIGYVEINVIGFDGSSTNPIHLCETCYEIAVKALNNK